MTQMYKEQIENCIAQYNIENAVLMDSFGKYYKFEFVEIHVDEIETTNAAYNKRKCLKNL